MNYTHSIGAVSSITGVSPTTLRRWVAKGHITAEVSSSGHRKFNLEEVQTFISSNGVPRQIVLESQFEKLMRECQAMFEAYDKKVEADRVQFLEKYGKYLSAPPIA